MDDLNAVEPSDMEINETRHPKTGRTRKLRTRLWTFGAVLSIVVNLILLAIVVVLGIRIFGNAAALRRRLLGA